MVRPAKKSKKFLIFDYFFLFSGTTSETNYPNFNHPPPTHIPPPPNHIVNYPPPYPPAPPFPPPYHGPHPAGYPAPPPQHWPPQWEAPWPAPPPSMHRPMPSQPAPNWAHPRPPGFMSPPPQGFSVNAKKNSVEEENTLDLDTRIELLLKGKGTVIFFFIYLSN